MPIQNNFNEVFARLKSIFQPYAKKMDAAYDTETYYLLNTRYIMKNKQPLCFGGVRRGKNYVSFYLMSVYACPELFKELATLTKAGATKFSDEKFIDSLRKVQGLRE